MSYAFTSDGHKLTGTLAASYAAGVTLVAWIKLTAAQWADTNNHYALTLATSLANNDNSFWLGTTFGSADKVGASSRDTGSTNTATHSFTDGNYDDLWVVVVATLTGDAQRNVYIESSSNSGSDTATRDLGAAMNDLILGNAGNGFNKFPGLLGPVALFDKVLSAAEIDALQTAAETGPAPHTVAPDDCIGSWGLGTDQGTHADESAAADATLTVTSAVYNADHPTITGGVTPAITAVGAADLDVIFDNEIRIEIDGSDFGASQGTGKVELHDDDPIAGSPTLNITQVIESWSDTKIVITADRSTIPAGANWLSVTENGAGQGARAITLNSDPGAAAVSRRLASLTEIVLQGQAVSVDMAARFWAVDAQDKLTLTVAGLPDGLGFDGESISGTVALGTAGVHNVTVDADDLDGNSAPQDAFTLTITTAAPVVLPLSLRTRFHTQRASVIF